MNEKFYNTMCSMNREHLHGIWEQAKADKLEGMNDEERQIARIMLEHEDEFFNQFEFADVAQNHEFDPDSEVNPFLHIVIHQIVENQLEAKEPIEAFQFYNAMLKKKCSPHESVHLVGTILVPLIFDVMQGEGEFDLDQYRSLLKKFKNRKPDKIPDLIEKEMVLSDSFDEELEYEVDEIPSAVAKKTLDDLIDRVAEGEESVLIRSKKGGEAVLIHREDFEFLQQTLDMVSDIDFGDEDLPIPEDDDPEDIS